MRVEPQPIFWDESIFEEVQPEPLLLNGVAAELPKRDALPTGPVFLADDWDTVEEQIKPELVPVADGTPLLYSGYSHFVVARGGSGKTWFALQCVADVVASGGTVLFIDYESNRVQTKERFKALGVTREEAGRIAYWRLAGPLKGDTLGKLLTFVDTFAVSLVVLDSIGKALGAAGFDENSNGDFAQFYNQTVAYLDARMVTSLCIDHTGKDLQTGFGSKKMRSPRGASNKVDNFTGAGWFFEVEDADRWSRQKSDGKASLICLKDRGGYRVIDEVAAVMHVEVLDDGAEVNITFAAGDGADGVGRDWLVLYMRRVSEQLELIGGWVSGRALRTDVTGSSSQIAAAVEELVARKVVEVRTREGRGGGKEYRSIKPFTDF